MCVGVLWTMLWSRWQGTGEPSAILQHIISKYSQCLPQPFRVTTTGTETGGDLQFWLLSFARGQKSLSSFLAGGEECQKDSALTSCHLSSPFTAPEMETIAWKLYARTWSSLRGTWTSYGRGDQTDQSTSLCLIPASAKCLIKNP